MAAASSRIRNHVRADVDEMALARPVMLDEMREDGGLHRTVDRWMVYDLVAALRTVTMVRYRHRRGESARRREVVDQVRFHAADARVALQELAELLRELAYVERTGG